MLVKVLFACRATAVILVVSRFTADLSTNGDAALPGLVNYRDAQPEASTSAHRKGTIDYR